MLRSQRRPEERDRRSSLGGENGGDALSAADAGRRNRVSAARAVAAKLMDRRISEPRARGAERMTERYRPTVRIEASVRKTIVVRQFFQARQYLRRERF